MARETLAAARPRCLGTPENVRRGPNVWHVVKCSGRNHNLAATSREVRHRTTTSGAARSGEALRDGQIEPLRDLLAG